MSQRQQLDHETLIGLIEALHSNGVLSDAERDALLTRRDVDEVRAAKEAFRAGRGPPEFAKGRGGPP